FRFSSFSTNCKCHVPLLFYYPVFDGLVKSLYDATSRQGFAKILYISTGMPAVFANPYASRSQHISSQKIAQLRFYQL
ncbi:MAG: hypothetical protein K8R28_03480, partial [Desulfobacterales bacterium]|nr:hypothetical protein [Desulfobacterales bacterium]